MFISNHNLKFLQTKLREVTPKKVMVFNVFQGKSDYQIHVHIKAVYEIIQKIQIIIFIVLKLYNMYQL